jgi:hypothetical protein
MGGGGEKLTGDWRKLRNEELHDLFSSPNIIGVTELKEDALRGTCVTHAGGCGVLVDKPKLGITGNRSRYR